MLVCGEKSEQLLKAPPLLRACLEQEQQWQAGRQAAGTVWVAVWSLMVK